MSTVISAFLLFMYDRRFSGDAGVDEGSAKRFQAFTGLDGIARDDVLFVGLCSKRELSSAPWNCVSLMSQLPVPCTV